MLRRELNELRCRESWLQHQHRLIHDPLAALGCEEAPQPWEATQVNGDSVRNTHGILRYRHLIYVIFMVHVKGKGNDICVFFPSFNGIVLYF